MGTFRDHPAKKIIRDQWCKPLVKHVKETLNSKLVYLGLPGVKALDIISWIDYIDKVIAFDCGDYNQPPDPEKAKKNLNKLNELLRSFEREGKISNYSLFNGYIERIVLGGLDETGLKFSQGDIVNIYNLDFCNSLTVPLKVFDEKGNVTRHYKLSTIRRLLEIERDILVGRSHKKFIMFLTVHSQFWEQEAKKLLDNVDASISTEYYSKILKLSGKEKDIRQLKLYVYHTLREQFTTTQFVPDFLPPIYYKGIGQNWLVCFTIIGTHHETPSSVAPFKQNFFELLQQQMISADKNKLYLLKSKNILEKEFELSSVHLFSQCETYKDYWNN